MKIYLSPSLQENNIGVSPYGTEEKRMNELADIVEGLLTDCGHIIYRNTPTMTLSQAVNDSTAKKVDIHVALHSNAFNGTSRGCEVFCHRVGGKGEKLAKSIYKYLEALTPTTDRGIKEGYNYFAEGKHLYETAFTTAPAVLIEVAFHDNPNDAQWIINNMVDIGITIANGINDYAGLPIVETDYKAKYDKLKTDIKALIIKHFGKEF
jgi:N-acetylmuramoyl-L-alanine amidase